MRQSPNEEQAGASRAPGDGVAARARKDPAPDAVPGQEWLHDSLQTLWSAWARRRYRDEFEQVTAFCLFIGYPRSGHSLVGAMLNAHRRAVISHELDVMRLVQAGCTRDEIYARILARAAWFNLRGNRSNYRYQIPNRWQGRFEALRVIGDKRGGSASLWLAGQRDLLSRLRTSVGVPVRLIHVVRNPYDNIAAIARWHSLTLDESIDFYFSHFQTTGNLDALVDDADVMTVQHEDFFRAPESTLVRLCSFLRLDHDPAYLAECSSIVFSSPTSPRRSVDWTSAQLHDVQRRTRRFSFLSGYSFEQVAALGWSQGTATDGGTQHAFAGLRLLDRLTAYFSPRAGL